MKSAFTLIELLVVIAIVGILAVAILVAINPAKRLAQTRDAQRKTAISSIANALIGYYSLAGEYPSEKNCDSSRGNQTGGGDQNCSGAGGSDWFQDTTSGLIYQKLVTDQGFLKQLPKDPLNNSEFYYKYEPSFDTGATCLLGANACTRYWIGARLEAVDNPLDTDKRVFRCTDMPINLHYNGGAGYAPGCREVLFDNAAWVLNGDGFDNSLPTDGLP